CRLLLGVLPRPITDKGPPKRLSPSLHQHHPPNKQRTGTSSLPCFVSLSSRRTARTNRPFSLPPFCSFHHYIQTAFTTLAPTTTATTTPFHSRCPHRQRRIVTVSISEICPKRVRLGNTMP